MRDFNVKAWLMALLIALLPCAANAVGLGRLNMLSALGEPLNAEIDLVSVTKEELSSLSARLAPADAYRRANLQYNAALVGARISIERRPNGQSYVKITSSRPVNEPFIDLLVEITSSSGRLMREYTVLVDPASVSPAPPAVAAAPVAPAARPAPEPPVAAAPEARRPPAPAPTAGAKEYGPIQRGDNLSKIAKNVMPEGVTLEQMMVGLYRSNPDAFIRKNLNLVKSGRILRVPDKEEVATIPQTEARKEFRAQVADWNAYRQGVAGTAGTARAEGSSAVSGRIGTKVTDKAPGEPRDVVRLSPGEPPATAGAEKGKPRSQADRIRALEEEVTAREKALNEANARIAQLEKTLKDMQKLMELKSPGMAAAQQQAEKAAKAKPEATPSAKPDVVATAKPEPAKPEAPKTEAIKPEPKPEPAAPKPEATAPAATDAKAPDAKAEAKAAAEQPKPAPPAEAAAPDQPKPKPKVTAAPPPPPPAPDMADQVIGALTDPLYLGVGGGAVLLGGLALWMARRRRREDDEAERAAPVLPGMASAAAPAAVPVVAAPPAPPPADEVDPLAEAEVYIAYGRDAQAEEILKEALAKNPQRQDAKVKLLEIYAARKDKESFNRLANEMHGQTRGVGDTWINVAAMGYALDPTNSVYAEGRHAAAPAPVAPASDLDFDLGAEQTTGATTDIVLDAGGATTMEVKRPDATVVPEPGDLQRMVSTTEMDSRPHLVPDFTLEPPSDPVTETDIQIEETVATQDSHMIDFQIELPKADTSLEKTLILETPPDTDSGVDFKLDIPDLNLGDSPTVDVTAGAGEKDGHWYDVQSKFDLAKAYQEMGDKDGAKDILQEVIKEGDAEQQAQAKKLLETIS